MLFDALRKFLVWQRRIFLGEEDWEFATTHDLESLGRVLDRRLKRRSAVAGKAIWSSRWRALSVHLTTPDRVKVFWNWGHWSPFPRILGGPYFDGRMSRGVDGNTIVGRFRHPLLSAAFLLLLVNLVLLWLVFVVALDVWQLAACLLDGSAPCVGIGKALAFLGLVVAAVSIFLMMVRYVAGASILGRRRIAAILTDMSSADGQ